MNRFKQVVRFLKHRIVALMYDRYDGNLKIFREKVLAGSCNEEHLIHQYRDELRNNMDLLEAVDLGAGSGYHVQKNTVAAASKRTAISSHYGRILYNLSHYYQPATIIELGTAFGISTLYLASGNRAASVFTIEGNGHMHRLASEKFKECGFNHIEAIHGNFDDWLTTLKLRMNGMTLFFIDGNHTYDATLRYFNAFYDSANPGIYVFDDINWSDGMAKAWCEIKQFCKNSMIIDLFQMGIIIKSDDLRGCNYML